MPIVTMTTANGRNGITPGKSRVTIRTDWLQVVDRFEVPSRQPRKYLDKHSGGQYAARLRKAERLARQIEKTNQTGQLPLLVA